ncbi:hypothetical protein C8D87_104182 [Lentzea atacamensis]|uniref:Uncharacterized protein n=1 Tax=Lentzea atacamensis TaxID=531938 RepID=A0ABX9EAX7_9PSEU|nr:hypothetical protein [Lentzea atacamensis]RAS65632.1 hypothetical protein C8D87_104182 [Lentzea atacamensis]
MTNNDNAALIQLRGVVQQLKTVGVTIPEDLASEIKGVDTLRVMTEQTRHDRDNAMRDLGQAPTQDLEKALREARLKWAESSVDAEFISRAEAIQQGRVSGAFYRNAGWFLEELTDKMNAVVDEYELNTLRLPPNLNEINPLWMTPEDQNSIEAFRSAVPILDSLWNPYKMVAVAVGHQYSIANKTDEGPSVAVAWLVSDVESSRDADALATDFRRLSQGVTSMERIRSLGIWGVISLSGFNIDICSPEEAEYRREFARNPASASAPPAKKRKAVLLNK